MKKISFCLFISVFLLNISCGESEKERIDKETAKIIVAYNDAIITHKKKVKEAIEGAHLFGISYSNIDFFYGSDWRQKGWDTLRVFYKIDSLEKAFKNNFGEDNYNVLKVKIDENWNKKMQ